MTPLPVWKLCSCFYWQIILTIKVKKIHIITFMKLGLNVNTL